MASIRAAMFDVSTEPLRIDRFVVLETLGAGGMGVVYAAHDPRLARRVALKLVKPEAAAGPDAEARLLREARAMARLSHPNVVQVHEVGQWDGRVYIAMELVAGQPLTTWLAGQERGWRDIVRVFVEAGQGLAAAHAGGIVHRDFKPANVLVGDDGRVRVTDFGLAQGAAAEPEEARTTPSQGDPLGALAGLAATSAVARAGTPAYMSPEQFLGAPATAASDQFSFCVALYQALHGVRPFAGDEREALARAVLAGQLREPPRLRIPRRVHRALVRGLSRDPARRFPTMKALLAAIEVRSPWRTVATASAFFAAGLGASAVVLDDDPCADADALLAGAWDTTTRAAAEQAFAASGLPEAEVLWTSTSGVLDRYAAAIAESFTRSCRAGQRGESSPGVHDLRVACLRRRLAVVEGIAGAIVGGEHEALRNATLAAGRLDDLGSCEDERALLLGMDPPPPGHVAELGRIRAALDRARSLELLGDMTTSAAVTVDAVAAASRLADAPTLAEALFQRGRLAVHGHQFAAAEEALRESRALALAARHDVLVAELTSWLIQASVQRRGEARDVEEWLREGEAWLRRIGASPLQLASLESARSIAYQVAGDHVAAEAASRNALTVLERELGEGHLEVAITRYNHANSLDSLGRTDEALAAYQRVLAVMRASVGEEHPLTADVLYNLGVARLRIGTPDELAQAEAELDRSSRIFAAVNGPHALEVASAGLASARVAHLRGELDAAENRVAEVLSIYTHHRDNPDRAHAITLRGALAYARGRLDEAHAAHEEARAVALAAWGPAHAAVGAADGCIADILLEQGDAARALVRYDAAVATLAWAHGDAAPELISPLLGRGEARLALGSPCEAAADFERVAGWFVGQQIVGYDPGEIETLRAEARQRCEESR